MPPLFSAIVESGYAKYHELDDVYTLKGAYDLFDTYCIRAENRTRYEEYAKAEAEKKRPAQNRRR